MALLLDKRIETAKLHIFWAKQLLSSVFVIILLATSHSATTRNVAENDEFAVATSSPVLNVTTTLDCLLKGNIIRNGSCLELLKEGMTLSDEFIYSTGLPFSVENVKGAKLGAVATLLKSSFANWTASSNTPGIFVSFLVTDPANNFKNISSSSAAAAQSKELSLSGIILDWRVAKSFCNPSWATPMADLKKSLLGAPIGIGYSSSEKHSCLPSSQDLEYADFIQITIEFNASNLKLSYGLFAEELEKTASKHERYLRGTTGSKRVFYNLRFSEPSKEPGVYSLFTQFGVGWGREFGRKVILDTDHFLQPELLGRALRGKIESVERFRDNVILSFDAYSAGGGGGGEGNHSCHPCKLLLPVREMVTLMWSTFNTVLLSYDTLRCTMECWNNGKKEQSNSILKLAGDGDHERRIYVSLPPTINPLLLPNMTQNIEQHLDSSIRSVFLLSSSSFGKKGVRSSGTDDNAVAELLTRSFSHHHVRIGCEVELRDVELSTVSNIVDFMEGNRCEPIFEQVSLFVWKLSLEVRGLKYEDILEQLENIRRAGDRFVERHLGTGPKRRYVIALAHPWLRTGLSSGLYCDEFTLKVNLVTEAIGNWASIRNVQVVMCEAFDLDTTASWWSLPRVPNRLALNNNPLTFLPLQRNYPGSMASPQSAPCIQQSAEPPKTGIQFHANYSGVSLDLTTRKSWGYSQEKLVTLMQYTFHKFSLVEILLEADLVDLESKLNLVREGLQTIFYYGTEAMLPKTLYLEIPLPQSSSELASAEFLRTVQATVRSLVKLIVRKGEKGIIRAGIHFSGWEKHCNSDSAPPLETFLLSVGKDVSNVFIGLTVENCVSELNLLFTSPHSSPSTSLFSRVNYIVCQESPVNSSNRDMGQMTSYLDGHLVVKTAFQRQFPNLTVHFRLNSASPHLRDDLFLNFISDVVSFSSKYNISYFLFRTLDEEGGTNGWWRRTNTTVHLVEREAEYHGKPSWHPTPIQSHWREYILGGVLTFAGLVVLALPIGGWMWKRRNRNPPFLSDEEVKDFMEGSVHLADADIYYATTGRERGGSDVIAGENNYIMMRFNEQYNLAKDEFEIDFHGQILGSGNFGMVYNGKVKGVGVAVKVQHSGCSKSTFKSMLNEVKILSWIGSHPNVLAFVGCYTQEIKKGLIYIATELCANGNLQSHLRTKTKNDSTTPEGRNYENQVLLASVQELVRFATEIGSGMEYISRRKVVHGDLSTRNVLLDGNYVCKIGDFGLSRKLYEYYGEYVKSNRSEPLPWRWMALESLKFMEFTSKSDVWGYGVTVWEIFSLGEVPYSGRAWSVDFRDEIENGMRLTKPHVATEEIYAKMTPCWNVDPELRPTFRELRTFFEGLLLSAQDGPSEDAKVDDEIT